LAFDAILDLINKGENIHLHFFGDGPMRSELEERAESSSVSNNFIFHGEVDDPYSKIKGIDFVLITSLFESFGYVALEAMLLRVPLISSCIGGLPEVISNETAIIFDPTIDGDIKEKILYAVSLENLELEKMTEKAHKDVISRLSLGRMTGFLEKC